MQLTQKAYAKINLVLDVLGLRADGYHDLFSIMQAVDLYDEVTVSRDEEPGIRLTVEGLPEGEVLPADSSNLAYKAAEKMLALYMENQSARHPAARMLELWEEQRADGPSRKFGLEAGVRPGATIRLAKRIPMAAGLAGGSADAAAVILALNKLLYLSLPLSRLCEIGKTLGADVPFCILAQYGKHSCASAEGIGEVLTPLPSCKAWVVLCRPNVQISTPKIFKAWDAANGIAAGAAASLTEITAENKATAVESAGRIQLWKKLLEQGDLLKIAAGMGNDLEPVSCSSYPEIVETKEALEATHPVKTLMSGSGPTVFALYETEEDARRAYDSLRETMDGVFLARTL